MPTRTGYTFRGWYYEETYTTQVTETTVCQEAQDHNLYARWEKNIEAQYDVTRVTCYGLSTGKITVSQVTGGNESNYTLTLYKGGSEIQSQPLPYGSSSEVVFEGLAYGTDYSVKIYDGDGISSGCMKEISNITVTQPNKLVLSEAHDPMNCNQYGSIHASWTGGNSTFNVSWNSSTSSGSTGLTLTASPYHIVDLFPQTYNLYIVDDKGCKDSVKNIIVQQQFETIDITNMAEGPVCLGDDFHVVPQNGVNGVVPDGVRYTWVAPSMPAGVTGATAGDHETDIHSILNNTTGSNQTVVYTVRPTLGLNCMGHTFTVTVTVGTNTCADVNLELVEVDDQCPSNPVVLTATLENQTAPYQLVWNLPGGITRTHTGLTGTTDTAHFTIPSGVCATNYTYTVIYTDNANNSKTAVGTIPVVVGDWNVPTAGTSSITCVKDLAQPTANPIQDGCGRDINPTFVGATYNPNPLVCSGTATYTFSYKDCNNTIKYWTHTVTVTGETIAPVIASDAISSIAAKKSSTECRFYVPDIVSEFRNKVSDACTTNPTDLSITQSVPEDVEIFGTTIVTVTVKDKCGNEATKTVTVTVPDKPAAPTLTHTNVLCYEGNTGTATVTDPVNGYTYTWSNGQSSAWATGQANPKATGLSAGAYTVTVTDGNYCTVSTNVTIDEPAKLVVNANTTAYEGKICEEEKTNIYANVYGGTPAYSYAWSSGISGNASMGEVEPTTTTDYIVTVTDNNGCTAKDTIKVTVNPLPAVTIAAVDPICENATATLVATVSNMSDVSYEWSSNSSTTNTADYTAAGTYTVYVTNNTTNCYNTATATVSRYPAFVAGSIDNAGESICVGGNAPQILSTAPAAGGHGDISYQWYVVTVNGSDYVYAAAAGTSDDISYTIDNSYTQTAGTYTFVRVAKDEQCVTDEIVAGVTGKRAEGTYTLTVIARPEAAITNPTGIDAVCVNSSLDNTTLTLNATPTEGNYSYLWSLGNGENGTVSGSATNNTFSAFWSTPGTKQVSLTVTDNTTNCSATVTKTITVNDVPSATISGTPEVCPSATNQTITGTVTSTATPNYTFAWTGGGLFTDQTQENITTTTSTVTIADMPDVCNTNYTINLKVTDGNGCSANATPFTLTVKDATAPTFATGDPIMATPAANCTYTMPSLNIADVLNRVTNDNCSYGTVSFVSQSVPVGTSYNQSSAEQTIPVTVVVEDACHNTVSQTVNVTIPANTLAATISGNTPICKGASSTITVTSVTGVTGTPTYAWAHETNNTNTTTVTPATSTVYTVTVTGDNGCQVVKTQNIVVNPLPTVTVQPVTVCAGQGTATLSAVGTGVPTLQYEWKDASNQTVGNDATLTVDAPATETTYTVTVKDGNQCTNTATGTISVYTPVQVTVNNAEICADGTATLTAALAGQSNALYSWAPSTYLSAATGASVTFSGAAASTTAYTVTVTGTDDHNCTSTATSTITVNPLPAVAISPVAQLCPSAGSTPITAEVTTTTATPYTFSWNASTGLTLSVQTDNAATSQVTASFAPACSSSYTVNLNIEDAKGCTATAEPVTITVKDEAAPEIGTIADVTATAAGNCQYVMPNLSATVLAVTQDNVCGYTGNAVTFVSQSVPAGTSYTQTTSQQTIVVNVVVKDACGNTANKDVNVIIPANDFTATITDPYAICYGADATTITVTPSNASGTVTYNWSSSTSESYIISNNVITVTPTANTTYNVTATDGNGCTVELNTTVTVNALPVVTVSNATVCNGQGTAELVATVTGAEPFTYVWKDANNQTVGENNATLTLVNPAVAQDYTVTVTDDHGCVNSGTGHLSLDTIPNIQITNTLPAEVCANSTLQLTADKGETYVWEAPTGVTLSATTGASVNFSATTAGQYTVTVTGTNSNGCHAPANITITVNALPVPEITSTDLSICQGQQTTTLTVTGATGEYKWNNNKTDQTITVDAAGTYTVTVTDAKGCKGSASATVTANPMPTVTLAADNATICPDGQQSAVLTATANGGTLENGNTYTYVWTLGETTITPAVPTTYTTSVTGTYKVKVTDDQGCYAESNTVIINNHTLPTVTVNSANICASGTATLMANGAQTYTWDPATYLTTNNANATFSGAAAGTYTVTVTGTDGNGCHNTAVSTIKVNPDVVLTLADGSGAKDQNLCANSPLTDIVFNIENATISQSAGVLPAGVTFDPSTKTISGTPTQTGMFEYTIKATSNQTNPVCDPVTITGTIKVNPTVQLTVTPLTQEICAGGNIQDITLTSVNGTLPATLTLADGLTYNRTDDFNATITGSIATASATDYIYNITSNSNQTNPVCESATQAVTIIVHPNPVVSITDIPTVCPANSTQSVEATITTPTTANYTYAWTGGVVITPATTTTDDTSNTVSAAVPVVCDNSYTINLTVTDHYGCQATDTKTMTVKDETTPTIAVNATNVTENSGHYYVTASTIGNCKYKVPDLTTSDYVTVADACTTQPLQVTQNITAGTQFTDAETSKEVVVTVTDGCGKTATVTITVQKPAAVDVNITADVPGVCKGDNATLTASATSGNEGNITYTWSPNTGLSATNTATVTATPQTTTTYTVVARDGNGCSAQETVTVEVYTLPTVTIADVADICPNAGS